MQIEKNIHKLRKHLHQFHNTRVLQVLTTQPNTQNALQKLTTQPNTEKLQVTQSTTEMFSGNQISDIADWDLLNARELPYALLPSKGRRQSSSSGNLA